MQALVSKKPINRSTGQGYNLVAHWKLHGIARYRDDSVRLEWNRPDDPGKVVRAGIASAIRAHLASSTERTHKLSRPSQARIRT